MEYTILQAFQIYTMLWVTTKAFEDLPCVLRFTEYGSVCVCNASYCDTITREAPEPGHYVSYTSSKLGSRFFKNRGVITKRHANKLDEKSYNKILELHLHETYQTIEGFGGAVTDSAGINWKSLPAAAQQHLINSYCSKNGIEFNMIRVPCGSTDFSTRFWAYNEYPVNDTQFTNFTLSFEDVNYKVPMIQSCMKVATADVKVITATWSPPKWLTTKEWPSEFVKINKDLQQAYADYHCKFAELYKEQDIKIWASSIANEPLSVVLDTTEYELARWTVPEMMQFLVKYFGPSIRNCSVEGIKILAIDDNRHTLPFWISMDQRFNVNYYIDGISLHSYTDKITPPTIISRSRKYFPGKFFISTEFSTGAGATNLSNVKLGSWLRAKDYIEDILENLNYNVIGWLGWNMCLNKQGGPNRIKNYVDSPVIVNAETREFYKQPMYYVFGHFSKFIPRGSKRIGSLKKPHHCILDTQLKDIEEAGQSYYDSVAFLTPRGTIVVVIHNDGHSQTVVVQIEDQQLSVILEEESITTVEFNMQN